MNKRQRQLYNNLNAIFGMYGNGMSDEGLEAYPMLNADKCIAYATSQLYDMKDDGYGTTWYDTGICKDLKFLGTKYINEQILKIADECGVLETRTM